LGLSAPPLSGGADFFKLTVVNFKSNRGGQILDLTPSPHFSGERDGVRGKKI